jgi:integrase/recombinase XerD
LKQFAAWHRGLLNTITPRVLRAFLATTLHLGPATRARKQAALASFLTWAYRQEFIDANPMGRVERIKLTLPTPRGVGRERVGAILEVIPPT